jgi:hypothetical protein
MIRNALRFVVSLGVGVAVGVVAHYALYRMALPVEPFIYLAF